MDPDLYARNTAANFQGLFSNVLMGMREARASEDQSMRAKAFEQEQVIRKYQLEEMEQKRDLEKATIFGTSQVQGQNTDLYNMASVEDFEGLKRAQYKPIELEGASPRAVAIFNNQQREAFNLNRANLLAASAGQKHRLEDINNLTTFSTTLKDPVARGIADEARTLLQSGVPISELSQGHAAALRDAGTYAAKQALQRNPAYMSKLMEITVNSANKNQDNEREDIKTLIQNSQENLRTEKTIYGQAVASGNTKAMEAQEKKVQEAETKLSEMLAKGSQTKRGVFNNDQGVGMMEKTILPKEAKYRLTVIRNGKTFKPLVTEQQYQEALAGQEKGELNIINYEILSGQ